MKNTTARQPLFIFEMANNHQGEVRHGLRIIEELAKITRKFHIRAGIKLQYRDLTTFIHPDHRNGPQKHIQRFLSTELSKQDYQTLVFAIKDSGLTSICTPFDETSVTDLTNHGTDIIKVASCSANDWPLLESIAAAKKPVICSTGGLRAEEMDQVVNFFQHRNCNDLSLLHCVGIYPTANHQMQLHVLDWMIRRFHWLTVGYSGHEAPDNTDVVKIALSKGAKILERHVGVSTDQIKLNAYSLDPDQVSRWVESALTAIQINGNPEQGKLVAQEELDSLLSLRRGVYARQPIRKGESLSPEKVFFAMPCQDHQTTTSEYLETMVASEDYEHNSPLRERRQISWVTNLRSLIHQAKGMLHEANIAIGDQYQIEMSHHYGPENFRSYGALIVNLVNREYCKKLIIVLPSQRHPKHRHLKKEETFQLLYGDLQLDLDGKSVELKPGQLQLIERGMWHTFSSNNGAIFEEVSTTHVIGDSYYDDPRISRLDPIQRKTVLDMW